MVKHKGAKHSGLANGPARFAMASVLASFLCAAPLVSSGASLSEAKLAIRTKQNSVAEQKLTQLAKAGDAEAQYLLGSLYSSGTGVKRDYSQSLQWFTLAAEQGHAGAAYNLAALYENGKGTAKNPEQAVAWYQRAAKAGSVQAEKKLTNLQLPVQAAPVLPSSSQLLKLVRTNDIYALNKAVQQPQNLDALDSTGYTALIFAIEKDNSQAAEILLVAGASPDAKNAVGDTPLTFATQLNRSKLVALLLRYKADINLQDKLGNTPLHIAANKNHSAIASTLLAQKADPNLKNLKAFTALDYASAPTMQQLLKASGAKAGKLLAFKETDSKPSDDVLAKSIAQQAALAKDETNPFKDWPALNVAAWRGQAQHVELLLKSTTHIDIDSLDGEALTPLARAAWQGHTDIVLALLAGGAKINYSSPNGETPLSLAVSLNHLETVNELLKHGAVVGRINDGGTPLEPLINIAAQKGYEDMALKLLAVSKKAPPTFNGKTPLMWAAQKKQPRLLSALLKAKAPINERDNLKRTALLLAVVANNAEAVTVLLRAGADAALADSRGDTPLAAAAKSGFDAIAQQLMESRDYIDLANQQGNTPLMLAAQAGHYATAKNLLARGASVTARNNTSHTALMLAAQAGHLDCVKLMLEHGATLNRRNRDGKSALDLAKAAKQSAVVQYLEQQAKSQSFF